MTMPSAYRVSIGLFCWLLICPSSSTVSSAQPPARKPPSKLDSQTPRQPFLGKSIKADPHIKPAPTREVVDVSYLRMNRPQVITGMVTDVQQGKLPRQALKDVASPKAVDALMATRWTGFIPETQTSRLLRLSTPQKVDSRKTPMKPIAQYTSDQMAMAQWSKIQGNVTVSRAGPVQIDYANWIIHSPHTINLGTFPYYQKQTAVLSVTSPTDGMVKASWKQGKPIPKIGWLPRLHDPMTLLNPTMLTLAPASAEGGDGFSIDKMVSYTGLLNKGSPQIDQTVTGGGPLKVKAGQDLIVVISFKSPYKMGGATPTLVVSSEKWSIDVPVKYNILSIEEFSASAQLDGPLVNLVTPWQPPDPNTKTIGIAGLSDGSSMPFGLTVKNTGDKAITAKVEAMSLPTGISMTALNVALSKNDSKHVTLTFKASPGTPTGKAMPGSIKVTYAKDKSLTLSLQFSVRESYVEWTDGWSITDKVKWTTKVTASSSGVWHWTAHLKDSSTWYGDAFVVGFYFNTSINGLFPGMEEQGTLGAKYSGPATNYWIDHGGVSQKISTHWPEVYDNGVWFFGNAYGDLTAIVEWMAKTGLSVLIGAL